MTIFKALTNHLSNSFSGNRFLTLTCLLQCVSSGQLCWCSYARSVCHQVKWCQSKIFQQPCSVSSFPPIILHINSLMWLKRKFTIKLILFTKVEQGFVCNIFAIKNMARQCKNVTFVHLYNYIHDLVAVSAVEGCDVTETLSDGSVDLDNWITSTKKSRLKKKTT